MLALSLYLSYARCFSKKLCFGDFKIRLIKFISSIEFEIITK